MTRRVCEYHWERTFRQTLCLRALAANLCSSYSCLESNLSCKLGQTMGFSAKLCVSKWRSFVSCHTCVPCCALPALNSSVAVISCHFLSLIGRALKQAFARIRCRKYGLPFRG